MVTRVYLTFIGLTLFLIGGVFVGLMGRSYWQARQTRQWNPISATILESRITSRQIGTHVPTDYSAFILYEYAHGENMYTSTTITPRGTKWVKEKQKIDLTPYPVDGTTTCWVNPKAPHLALLKHDSLAAGYSIWFPALIGIGGIGVILGSLKSKKN